MIISSILVFLIGISSISDHSDLIEINSATFNDSAVLELHSLGDWYYRTGDKSEWASPDVSIVGWKLANLSIPVNQVPDDWDGIGWFRTTIRIDSTLFGKQMGI